MSVVGPRPLAQVTYDTYPSEAKEKVYNQKPGITGIGSIIFRDEEHMMSAATEEPLEFYKKHIAPYKAALEIWYGVNASTVVDFKIIVLTIWVIIFPTSSLQYQWIKGLPEMPQALKEI
jgi:lipopolysaccharide/colanic/teichoic acid biosynthesis glycosyltransferase